MALKNLLMLGSLLAIFMVSEATWGQVDIPSPKFQYKSVESPEATRPFATPGVFDYDAQMWTPVEFTNGENWDPRCGFYASYDRTYLSFNKGSRGANTDSVGNHYVWGTRIEAGWMTEADDGWGLVYQYGNGIHYSAGQDQLVGQPLLVDSQASNFELNKIFRQGLKKGGYFEPYLGVRYYNMSDRTIEDTNQIITQTSVVGGVVTTSTTQVGNRFKQNASNSAIGGQGGARFNSRRGRWRLTSDGAIAMFYNQQRYFSTDISTSTTPTTFSQGIIEFYDSDQSFVPMLDLQLEMAYNLSRDISLKGGVQLNYLWNGINRANIATTTLNPNSAFSAVGIDGRGIAEDQDFITAGFIFGMEWRK
jgi:hypothetical protein